MFPVLKGKSANIFSIHDDRHTQPGSGTRLVADLNYTKFLSTFVKTRVDHQRLKSLYHVRLQASITQWKLHVLDSFSVFENIRCFERTVGFI